MDWLEMADIERKMARELQLVQDAATMEPVQETTKGQPTMELDPKEYFTTNHTGNVVLKEGAPEELLDYVRKAHDTELPNNWVWEKCAYFWGTLCEGDDMDEAIDSAVDIWWADLFQWLADMPLSRKHYCDRALDEGVADGSDFSHIVLAGQYLQLCEIAELMREAYDQATMRI